ncbi:hypothetical protein [Pseudomonas donghuensis]|uniref:hypothetical protein n=1 Tax=Pseudomonas donghuensis TaxID=1163398 RepID=UPI002E0E11B3|nr:hypothetical protein VP780_21305 [Pseudomonas donghuensis]
MAPLLAVMKNMLRMVGSFLDITSALNDFKQSYHQDFANVQPVARRYLNAPSGSANAVLLAQALSTALRNWGACKRRSPILRPVPQIESALKEKRLHDRLLKLSQQSLSAFSLDQQENRLLENNAPFNEAGAFDKEILGILNTLADVLFFNNTSVTYPMKALLLITGLMPALDSQVRGGLTRAGKAGFTGQQLLPRNAQQAAGRRICELPFYLGHCWSSNREVFMKGILGSNHQGLQDTPGRVFDILLFMQNRPNRKRILAFDVGPGMAVAATFTPA